MSDPKVTISIANPTLALVSDGTVFVDGEGHPGVITVHRFDDDQIEIRVHPLTQLPYPLHLEIVLDSTDLAHIKSLLDAQDRANAEQPDPSTPSDPDPSDCYDCRTNQTRLAAIENALAGDGDENIGQFGRLAAIEQRIDRLMHEAANQTRLDILDSEYVTLCQAIDALKNWQRIHSERLAALENAPTPVLSRAWEDAIETRLSELEQRMGQRIDASIRHSQRLENLEKLSLATLR